MPKEKPGAASLNTATLDASSIKQAERLRFRQINAGLIDHRIFLKPCRVKILMLVDTGISYNQYYFGLSEVLDTLRTNPEWWVKFDVTRAHRQLDPNPPASGSAAAALYAPDFERFRFDQPGFNINDYDEVWFYGFNTGGGVAGACGPTPNPPPNALTDKELSILYAWMNEKKGGVFATGDHANLGEALCSRIPRVRNMRKWAFNPGNPAISAPSNVGPNRHDTLLKGRDLASTALDESNQYTFDDESDDLPMKLRLRWYYNHYSPVSSASFSHWLWPYKFLRSPHPVMCGAKGPIDILPDHPHEGEVVVPAVLTDTINFCGYSAREYPNHGSAPLSPQIIAWARVQNNHSASDFKGVVNAKEFGAVGAYNGHWVGVGRVITDSTWHHWFDVNLTGRMELFTDTPGNIETGDLRKLNGFNDTLAGKAALARIRNYYRNVAIWLSPPDKIKCMSARAWWGSLDRFPLVADLRLEFRTPIWEMGKHAIDVLGNYAGQCNARLWWVHFVNPKLLQIINNQNPALPLETLLLLDAFASGGILQAMLEARAKGMGEDKQPADKDLYKLCERGVSVGLKALLEHRAEFLKSEQVLLKNIEELS